MSSSGASGNKFRISLGLPTGAIINCADNTGARNLYILAVKGFGARLNRLPAASVGDMVMATVKKGKPELRKKVMPAIVVRQSKAWRRKDGVFLYFEDNAGVIVNPKGEMKGSAITGPVGKECADLWPHKLNSSSIKERNEALNDLERLTNLQNKVPSKILSGITDSLIKLVESDQNTYLNRESSAVRTRLERSSYTLRKLISKNARSLKYKAVKSIIEAIPRVFYDWDGNLFLPLLPHFSKILLSVISESQHRHHLKNKEWVKLTREIIKSLNKHYTDLDRNSTVSNYVIELLSALRCLIGEPTINFKEVHTSLTHLVLHYFRRLRREDLSTTLMLEITNYTLLNLSTLDTRSAIDIIHVVLEGSISSETKHKPLLDQFDIFYILSSEFLSNNLRPLIDEAPRSELDIPSSVPNRGDHDMGNAVLHCLNNLLLDYDKSKENLLTLNAIEFNDFETSLKDAWFDFGFLRLKDTDQCKKWISLFALMKLIFAYYLIKTKKSKLDEDNYQSWKRRKVGNSVLQNALTTSETFTDFIKSCLQNQMSQLLGLQIFSFYLNYAKFEENKLEIDYHVLYASIELRGWTSLAIKSSLKYGIHFSNEALSQALRINLQMIKNPVYSSVSAQTIIEIISCPGFHIRDRSLTQVVVSVFELSEINGPGVVNNDTLLFWVVFSKYGQGLGKKASKKIIDWIITKWDTLDADVNLFSDFIYWLLGGEFRPLSTSKKYNNLYSKFNYEFQLSIPLSRYILRSEFRHSCPVRSISFNIPSLPTTVGTLKPLVSLLITKLNSLESSEVTNNLIGYLSYGHSVLQYICEVPGLERTFDELLFTVRRLLEGLDYGTQEMKETLVKGLLKFSIINESGRFLSDVINIDLLRSTMAETTSELLPGPGSNRSHIFDDFGSVRKERDPSHVENPAIGFRELHYQDTVTQDIVLLTLKVYSEFGFAMNINTMVSQVVLYLEKLSPKEFTFAFFSLVEALDTYDVSSLSGFLVEKLLKIVGTTILQDYCFEKSPLPNIVLSKFMTKFLDRLIVKNSDARSPIVADISNWLLALAREGTIYQQSFSSSFLKLFFEILKYNEAIESQNSQNSINFGFSFMAQSTNIVKLDVLKHLDGFIKIMSYDEQCEFSKSLITSFETFQSSDEDSATLCLCFEKLSEFSYPLLVDSLFQLFRNFHYFHFEYYSKASSKVIIDSVLKTASYERLLLEIFSLWYNNSYNFETFPYSLLNATSFEDCIKCYSNIICPFVFSRKERDTMKVLNEYVKKFNFQENEFLSLIGPLAFTKNGGKTEIIQRIRSELENEVWESQSSLMVMRYIQLIDLSDEFKLVEKIPQIKSSPYSQIMFNEFSIKLYSLSGTSISISDGIYQIEGILRDTKGWNKGAVYHIAKNIISSIINALNNDERLLGVRRLKLLYILAPEQFKTSDMADLVFNFLSVYVTKEYLHDEISVLLVTVLKNLDISLICIYNFPSALFQLYLHAVQYKCSDNVLNPFLLSFLREAFNELSFDKGIRSCFSPLHDLLLSSEVKMDADSLCDLLSVICQRPNRLIGSLMIEFMTILFTNDNSKTEITYELKTEKETAVFLRNLIKPDLPKSVKLFISRYLGKYYMESGDPLTDTQLEFGDSTLEDYVEEGANTLDPVITHLLGVREATSNLDYIIGIDIFLGSIFNFFRKNNQLAVSILSCQKPIERLSKCLFSIDGMNIDLFHHQHISYQSLETSISPSSLNLDLHKWTSNIVISILQGLSSFFPVLNVLVQFYTLYPELSRYVVNYIWCFYIRINGSRAANEGVRWISNIAAVKDLNELGNEKLKIVLQLCHMIRVGSVNGLKHFTSMYKKLDRQRLQGLAVFAGMNKFGLLLAEEADILANTDSIFQIYNGLKDEDLLYGIPVKPSLEFALNTLKRGNNSDSLAAVMFNSAKFDASISLGQDTSVSKKQLLSALSSNSLNGLSVLVNDLSELEDETTPLYDWSWKLNQWDIPTPTRPLAKSEITYSLLKAVKEQGDSNLIKALCEDTIDFIWNPNSQLSDSPDLMKTLCTVFTIEKLFISSGSDLAGDLKHYAKSIRLWADKAPFSYIEDLIRIRIAIFRFMANRFGREESIIATAYEFSNFGRLSRLNGESQKAINSSVMFDEISKSIQNPDLRLAISKLTNFDSACMLWEKGETVIPIAMLLDNIKRKVVYNNELFSSELYELPESVLYGHLVKWSSESRQKKSEDIMTEYVGPALNGIENIHFSKDKSTVYHMIGYFCYKQMKKSSLKDEIDTLKLQLKLKTQEAETLKVTIKSKDVSKSELSELKKDLSRIIVHINMDHDRYQLLIKNREFGLKKAIHCFLRAIATDDNYDDEDIDKFFALWFQFSDEAFVNEDIRRELSNIPTHKFIPWMAQLSSRLNDDCNDFQKVLQALVVSISRRHPFHCLYHIMNLISYSHYESDDATNSRVTAAKLILSNLNKPSKSFSTSILHSIRALCSNIMALATEKGSPGQKFMLQNLEIGRFWIDTLPSLELPLPTINNAPISLDCNYKSLPRILQIDPTVVVADSGISKPKIMKITLTDGTIHKAVLKGGTDDLRQDAIMEQVLNKVNIMFRADMETRKRNLRVRTYKVVPLGPQCGIIEFVSNSVSLNDVLRPLHDKDPMSSHEARDMMNRSIKQSSSKRIAVFKKITNAIQPKFRYFFFENFPNVDDWYRSRQIYTRGVATTSFVGYMMGLGDRHLNNVLLDRNSGEPIHIDFGVTFDQGRYLPIPELVPFRLTRDMIDGLGITGVKGSFEKCSEHVYRVLRQNSERILGILDVLEFDPLHSWAMSSLRRKKMLELLDDGNSNISASISKDGSDALRAIKGVEYKLTGNGLSVEATVQELIQEATDPEKLGVIYHGWSPFY
ncbi:hypothetical protein WICMUC_005501 [Wickerhamomyces mucosus]|uniref:Serine/threonine-protein kinase TEL1 n=2 Tax=Eukaryota TaxID=2759 RepID=A0A9P8P826_9ASCO|nr:hypothetical protein WICMUC_005501 [Wickerhamomyces mucosus]